MMSSHPLRAFYRSLNKAKPSRNSLKTLFFNPSFSQTIASRYFSCQQTFLAKDKRATVSNNHKQYENPHSQALKEKYHKELDLLESVASSIVGEDKLPETAPTESKYPGLERVLNEELFLKVMSQEEYYKVDKSEIFRSLFFKHPGGSRSFAAKLKKDLPSRITLRQMADLIMNIHEVPDQHHLQETIGETKSKETITPISKDHIQDFQVNNIGPIDEQVILDYLKEKLESTQLLDSKMSDMELLPAWFVIASNITRSPFQTYTRVKRKLGDHEPDEQQIGELVSKAVNSAISFVNCVFEQCSSVKNAPRFFTPTFNSTSKSSTITSSYDETYKKLKSFKTSFVIPDFSIECFDEVVLSRYTKIPVEVKLPALSPCGPTSNMLKQLLVRCIYGLSQYGIISDGLTYFGLVKIESYEDGIVSIRLTEVPFDKTKNSQGLRLTPDSLTIFSILKTIDEYEARDIDGLSPSNLSILNILTDLMPQDRVQEKQIITQKFTSLVHSHSMSNIPIHDIIVPESVRDKFESNIDEELVQTIEISGQDFIDTVNNENNKGLFSEFKDDIDGSSILRIEVLDKLNVQGKLNQRMLDMFEEEEKYMIHKTHVLKNTEGLNNNILASGVVCVRSDDNNIFSAGIGQVMLVSSEENQWT